MLTRFSRPFVLLLFPLAALASGENGARNLEHLAALNGQIDSCESILSGESAVPVNESGVRLIAPEVSPERKSLKEVDAVEYDELPRPISPDYVTWLKSRGLAVSDVLEEIYDVAYDPRKIFSPEELKRFQNFSKIEDIVNKGLVIVTAPAWVPIAATAAFITKISSDGPVLFVQERLGRRGKPFKIYKLRTMRTNMAGTTYTQKNDPRITRSGAFFRRWKVDELFQLVNILKGDMNIIGHRPLVPEEVYAAIDADPKYGWKFLDKPGLSSLGQTKCDHCSTPAQNLNKARYDIYQMLNKGPKSFVKTLLNTVAVIVKGKGAR